LRFLFCQLPFPPPISLRRPGYSKAGFSSSSPASSLLSGSPYAARGFFFLLFPLPPSFLKAGPSSARDPFFLLFPPFKACSRQRAARIESPPSSFFPNPASGKRRKPLTPLFLFLRSRAWCNGRRLLFSPLSSFLFLCARPAGQSPRFFSFFPSFPGTRMLAAWEEAIPPLFSPLLPFFPLFFFWV